MGYLPKKGILNPIIIGPVKKKEMCKIVIIFLSINVNMCFGCSKEPSHQVGSFEYPQHMLWLRNKKINFLLHTIIWRPDYSASLD